MHQAHARCSEGHNSDQAVQGLHRAEIRPSQTPLQPVWSIEWWDQGGRAHASAGWGLPVNVSETEVAAEKSVQHTDKANSNNLLGAMAFVQES